MDSLEMNLLIENYIDEEKVCHNFPFRKFLLLLYAYRNYHQTVYLRKKELANVENHDRCKGSDSKNGFDGDSHEELSVNLVKSQYNFKKKKKKKKQICFGTSESFPSNVTANGRGKVAQCVGMQYVYNPMMESTHMDNTTGSSVIIPRVSGEVNLATEDTNEDQMGKLPGQGKNPAEKTYKKSNFENRTDSFILSKERQLADLNQAVEDYTEEEVIKLVYYFLNKFMFSKERKKKNKLRGKNSLLLMLERGEDGQANPMGGSKGLKKRVVNGASRGASRGKGKNGGAAEKGVTNEVKGEGTEEVKEGVTNEAEQTNCEKEKPSNGGDCTQGSEVGQVREICTGEAIEGGIDSADVKVAVEGEDKKELPNEGVSQMNNAESGKTNPHGDAHEKNGKACIGSDHEIAVKQAGTEQAEQAKQTEAAAVAVAGGEDADDDVPAAEGEESEEEEKRLELLINTFMNRKQICFSMNDIFYPFTNRNLNMSRKKQQNKKSSKNISFERSNNRFSRILGHVDLLDPRDSAPSRRYIKSKVISGKLKKGLNLLLKHEKKKKRKYRRHGAGDKVDGGVLAPQIGEEVEGSHTNMGGNIGNNNNGNVKGSAFGPPVGKAAGRKKGNKGATHTTNENEENLNVTWPTGENDPNSPIKSAKEKSGRGKNVGEKKGVKANNAPVGVNPSEAFSSTMQMHEVQGGVPFQMSDPRFDLHGMVPVGAIKGGKNQAKPNPRKNTPNGRSKQRDSGSTFDGLFNSGEQMGGVNAKGKEGYNNIDMMNPTMPGYYVGGEVAGQVGGHMSGLVNSPMGSQVRSHLNSQMSTPLRYDHPVYNHPIGGTPVITPNKGFTKKEKTGARKNIQKMNPMSKEASFYNAPLGATSVASISGGGGLYPYGNFHSTSNVDKQIGMIPPHGQPSNNTNIYRMNNTEEQRYAQEAHTINPYMRNEVMNKVDLAKNGYMFKGTNEQLQIGGPVGVDVSLHPNGRMFVERQPGENNLKGSGMQSEQFNKEYYSPFSGTPRSTVKKKNVKSGKKISNVRGVHTVGDKLKDATNQMGRDAEVGDNEDGRDPGGGTTSVGHCYDEKTSRYQNRGGRDDDNSNDGNTSWGGGGGGMGSSYHVGNHNASGRRNSVPGENRYQGQYEERQNRPEQNEGVIGTIGTIGSVEGGPIGVVGCGLGSTTVNHPTEGARTNNTLMHTSLNQLLDGKTRGDNTVSEMMPNGGINIRCTIVGNVTCMNSVVATPRDDALNGKELHGDLSRGKASNDVTPLGKGTIITKKLNQDGTFKEGHFLPANDTMKEQVGNSNGGRSYDMNMSCVAISEGRSREGTGNAILNSRRGEDIGCCNGVVEAKKMTCLQTQWAQQVQTMQGTEKLNQEDAKDKPRGCAEEVAESSGLSNHHINSNVSNGNGSHCASSGSSRNGGSAKLVSEDAPTVGCSSIVRMANVADAALNGEGANKLNYCSGKTYLEGVNVNVASSMHVHQEEKQTGAVTVGYLNHGMSKHARMKDNQEMVGPLVDSPLSSEAGRNLQPMSQSLPLDQHPVVSSGYAGTNDGTCNLGKINRTTDRGNTVDASTFPLRTPHSKGNIHASESSPVQMRKDNLQRYVDERGVNKVDCFTMQVTEGVGSYKEEVLYPCRGGETHAGGSGENRLPPVIVQQRGMKRKVPSLSQPVQGSKKVKGGLAMGPPGANSCRSRASSDGKTEGEKFMQSCPSICASNHSVNPLANQLVNPLPPSQLHNQTQQPFPLPNDGYIIARNTVNVVPSVAPNVAPVNGRNPARELLPQTTVELPNRVDVSQHKNSNTQKVEVKWPPVGNSSFRCDVNGDYEQRGLVGKIPVKDACTEKVNGVEKAMSSTLGKGVLRSEMTHVYGHVGRTVSDAKVHSIRSVSYAMNGESEGRRINAGGVLQRVVEDGISGGTNGCTNNSNVSNGNSNGSRCGSSRSYSILSSLKEREENPQGGMQECAKVRALPTEGKQFMLGSHDICSSGNIGTVGSISGDWGKLRPFNREPSGSRVVAKAHVGVQGYQNGNVGEGRGEYNMGHFAMATPVKVCTPKNLQQEKVGGVKFPSEGVMYSHPQGERNPYSNKVTNEVNNNCRVDSILANCPGDKSNLVGSMSNIAGTSLVGTSFDDLQRGVTSAAARNVVYTWDKGGTIPRNVSNGEGKITNRMEFLDKQSSNSATMKDEENGAKLNVSKKKKRKGKDTLLQEEGSEVKEQVVPERTIDDELSLCDVAEENANEEAKAKPKRCRRSRVGKDGDDQVVTGAYDENGEKISGVWYDTNRRLWRVMYMENDKRKTRGFSPRIYGFNLARELAVKLKYEMMEKNKK
ncbi:Uncharacterized protein PCOAH_00002050 [Plasmodium coatneyi]|uniref:AP2/ERF domain-containing protein n=1 Tax=Plasmodium coatneyi TaxID=208452 RepID=A0A1B1DSM3_9APIC|nr:Uncharacterized protein PCOAH_00002050 [Plasmodium coatneyi]ANQ05783.1 Uncharacterized protein PCOAH_00002050 [Plasmodium coatneyi]